MASDVDVCNMALAYLGDTATVASINPPSGSAQSSHCARFYPMALSELLEMHAWGFMSTRVALAEVDNPTTSWQYAYAAPSDMVNAVAILPPDATDDYTMGFPFPYGQPWIGSGNFNLTYGQIVPQPFQIGVDDDGNAIILTNQENAVLRYTRNRVDAARMPPLAVDALARLLASKLAGPLLKGEQGRAETKAQMAYFADAFQKAVESDSNQRKLNLTHAPSWIINR